ncbi:uncharacterized protein SETTUDRAFT_22710 [Exserohilum turcica Et28A]|uniref:Uncharacterized protein n=1 Tax=Exserohilum turcicum (strain 28A) TaxID=671987 RepID=R0K2Y1_EXST2|nr:uncharacterized protein SETTUDRAFT_22710 [Exserohilum turcica Et28A]EOA82742.1 hypothetical protein SETTUDRAFT_22710 [Exserohilum turcica Et28A]
MDPETEPAPELKWSAQYTLANATRNTLPGDKVLLPPSALEQLLAAAPIVHVDANRPHATAFDPFNPYTFDAERYARAQTQDQAGGGHRQKARVGIGSVSSAWAGGFDMAIHCGNRSRRGR